MSGNYSVRTNPIVSVQITSSGGPNKFIPIEKNIPRDESVGAVKGRLEVITSADRSTMTVKVFDRNDKLVCVLDNDDRLLGSYHIDDGMRLHVEDEFRLRKSLEMESNVEKFVMPEEDYVKRTEKPSDVKTTIGLSMSCPGKKGKLSDLKHKDTKQPRRPKLVDDNLVTVLPDEPPKQEETPNNKTDDTAVKKNLFVRKTAEISRKSNIYTPAASSPLTPQFAESSKSSSLASPVNRLHSRFDDVIKMSTLRPTAEEFTPSKRIPIIDPKTNREIVLDDVIPNGHAGDSAFTPGDNTVESLLYNSGYHTDYESRQSADFNNGDGGTVQIEIGKTIDYIVRQLLVNPGSFDDLMKLFDENIVRWGVADSTVEFILTCIIDVTVGLNNFSYLGAKICCHLDKTVTKIRPNEISIRNLVLDVCEVKFCELESLLMEEDSRNTAYSFIFLLAELYDQFQVKGSRIKALLEALCGTYTLLMKDPNSFNIRCLCKVLKLTGRNFYQDNGVMLQQIIHQLEDISRSHMFDSQTSAMLSSVIGLANCHWGLDESANGISSNTAQRAEGKGAEMYGPDGNILSYEEKKFLVDNCVELPEFEEPFDLQDSYADSDDGMDEEMQEAFEQFLLSVPEAR